MTTLQVIQEQQQKADRHITSADLEWNILSADAVQYLGPTVGTSRIIDGVYLARFTEFQMVLFDAIIESVEQPLDRMTDEQLAALYAGFADEDRRLAEEGMVDYVEQLSRDDQQ